MLSPLDPTLVDRQTRNNRETEGLWELYAEHRLRVNSLIEANTPDGRLVVLGAGNANSFDLESLAARFATLHLAISIRSRWLTASRSRSPPGETGSRSKPPST